jgi:hypothetical protein
MTGVAALRSRRNSDARGLRTGTPAAPPGIPGAKTRRMGDALISDLDWPAMFERSLYRSRTQQGTESDRRGSDCQLAHESLPRFWLHMRPDGCINLT